MEGDTAQNSAAQVTDCQSPGAAPADPTCCSQGWLNLSHMRTWWRHSVAAPLISDFSGDFDEFVCFIFIFNRSLSMPELSLSHTDRMEGFNRVAFRRKQHSLDRSHPVEAGECCSVVACLQPASFITRRHNVVS